MKLLRYVIFTLVFILGLNLHSNAEIFSVRPIGHVIKSAGKVELAISPQYRDALMGLNDFSHVFVFYWFDKNDSPEKRAMLKVHPRGNKENPLTGVFATHSPVRPNLIGLTVCKIKSINEGVITVDDIDAFDGTPIIDLKPYRAGFDCIPDASAPDWVNHINRNKKH